MFGFNKTKKLVTHDGSFHTDDVFACATLSIILEREEKKFKIIRTRDPEIIKDGDYVFDVGGIYDPESNRFDHHQTGGAGKRPNDIEYASFGLVWKKFGEELCKYQKAVDLIDKKLVAPIDAGDNGIDLVVEFKHEIKPYFIQSVFNSFVPGWKNVSEDTLLAGFLECVKIAKNILNNEITRAQDIMEAEKIILAIYQDAEDKRIIVLDKKYPYEQMQNYPEPIFVIYPRLDGAWEAEGVNESEFSFKNRKDFPISWAGLRDEELQKITGVTDAVFCHRGLFMAVAKSKEGAIELAKRALTS